MGNSIFGSFGDPDDADEAPDTAREAGFFDPAETLSLSKLYESISISHADGSGQTLSDAANQGKQVRLRLSRLLGSASPELRNFGPDLVRGVSCDFDGFIGLCAVLLTRGTAQNTLDVVLKALESETGAEAGAGTGEGTREGERETQQTSLQPSLLALRAYRFMLLLLSLGASAGPAPPPPAEMEAALAGLADRMREFAETYCRSGGVINVTSTSSANDSTPGPSVSPQAASESETASARLSSFVWDMFPFAVPLINTHYYRQLGLVPGVSWKAFQRPFFSTRERKGQAAAAAASMVPPSDMLPLALHSDRVQGELLRLYSTDTDGFDFLNIKDAIIGYEGGTVVLIRAKLPLGATGMPGAGAASADAGSTSSTSTSTEAENTDRKAPHIFGAYAAASYRDTREAYCSADPTNSGFVFTLRPHLRILTRDTFQYLNTKSFDKSTHGMGFGGRSKTQTTFPIFIPVSLEGCKVFGVPFELDCLEVYAAGGASTHSGVYGSGPGQSQLDAGLQAQAMNKKQQQATLERARTVDRAAFFNNEFDREMFLSSTFAHKQQAQNRDA